MSENQSFFFSFGGQCTNELLDWGKEIMRTVLEQGVALMIPEGDPNEASLLRQHIQVLLKLLL